MSDAQEAEFSDFSKGEIEPPEVFEDNAPVFDPDTADVDEHPTSVMSDDEEQEILDTNARIKSGEIVLTDQVDIHNDETEHNDDPNEVIAPPQSGETEPPDLNGIIKKERHERVKAIDESPIGSENSKD